MSAIDIFKVSSSFTSYRCEMQMIDKLVGGIPKNPDTIKKWLECRLEVKDKALLDLARETAEQMRADDGVEPGADELLTAVARKFDSGNGFKTINGHLAYEGRCLKSALKEAMNSAYPGTTFPGKPKTVNDKGVEVQAVRKGLMRYAAEAVHVEDNYIDLGVSEPAGTEQRIKHFDSPKGPVSAICVVDYTERSLLSCTVKVRDDFLPQTAWARVWETLESIGLGADRARGDGKFELVTWKKIK